MAQRAPTTKIRLNDQSYEFGLALYNPQGVMFPINAAALIKLSIEEDSREWFKRGYLIVNNGNNIIERRPNEFVSEDVNYKFRNDGRDLLLVNIKPIYDSDERGLDDDPFPSEGWELNYVFSVYDVEDISGSSPSDRKLKLYFWEYDYQLFAETTISTWGTNEILYKLYPELEGLSSVLPDEQRVVPTGLAIKGLISSILDDRSTVQKFSSDWDPGAGKIFYVSPTNNNAIDDLEYLFNRHIASKTAGEIDGDVPLLYRDRYSKRWILTSLSTELSYAVDKGQAGPRQLEQFYIDSSIGASVIIPSRLRTPQSKIESRNLNLGYLSNVGDYQFVDMSALDNTFVLINTPCSSNDIQKKQFVSDVVDNNIENIKSYFQTNYVNKFNNNKSPTALFSLNKSKVSSLIYKQPYSYGSTKVDRYADARNTVLKAAFFLNQCLSFTLPGSTVRRSNVFIGLDRKTGSVDADFDEKLLGQWYVIKVTHDFTQKGYNNTITAVKPHSDKDIRIKDDVL